MTHQIFYTIITHHFKTIGIFIAMQDVGLDFTGCTITACWVWDRVMM